MARKKVPSQGAVSFLFAAGGIILTVSSALPVLHQQQPSLAIILSFTAGISVLFFAVLIWFSMRAYSGIVGILFSFIYGSVHTIRNCRDSEISLLHEFAREQFGETITTPEQIKEIQRKFRDGLKIATNYKQGKMSILGYMFYFPLNKTAAKKIETFKFEASKLTAADIAAKPQYGYAMYVGAIAAKGIIAKSQILGALKSNEEDALKTRSRTIYARAASPDGLRVLKKHGFRAVHPEADSIGCFFSKKIE